MLIRRGDILKYEPSKYITLLFLGVIFISSILLWLPISRNEVSVTYVDALFTATSALCVTGLNTIDFANIFNTFGLTIIAILIQLGGLGIVCAAVWLFILLGQKIGLKQRIIIKNSFNLASLKGVVKFVLSVFKITFSIELFFAILIMIKNIDRFGFFKSFFVGLFHAISSFNNAGFDILSKYNIFDDFSKIITIILIILGGIGFFVIKELLNKKANNLSLQSKIVLISTFVLLVFGTIGYKLTTNLSLFDSLFLSVTTRTAGFCYWDLSNISNAGYLLTVLLMFIGASPTSTGGGIKNVTFFILILAVYSICRDRNYEFLKRSINSKVINRSLVILLTAILVIFIGTFIISVLEPNLLLKDILFETVSAYGTVGLSLGITSKLSSISKIVICFIMFIGRVGTITLLSIWLKENKKNYKYPEENIIVG